MNFCPNCGTRVAVKNANFCTDCGARLSGGSSSSGGGSSYQSSGGSSGGGRSLYRNVEQRVEQGVVTVLERNIGSTGVDLAKEFVGKPLGISGGKHPKWSPGESGQFCCQCEKVTKWKNHRDNCSEKKGGCGHRYCGRNVQGTKCGTLGRAWNL